jgi:hypothetical protein
MERSRISDESGFYFVTMSVMDWLPAFVSEQPCRMLTDGLNFCHMPMPIAFEPSYSVKCLSSGPGPDPRLVRGGTFDSLQARMACRALAKEVNK